MSTPPEQANGDDASEGVSHSADPFDELMENYNFICHPESRIKFKQQVAGCSIGICLAKPWNLGPRARITFKPSVEGSGFVGKYIQKLLVVATHSQVALFSRKVNLGWLRLQCVAGYNWSKQRPTLDYRVTTKWGDGPRLKRKEKFDVLDSLQLRCKWNLDFHLPDMEGHLGADNSGMDPVDVDWGRLEFEISQLDVVWQSPVKLWAKKIEEPSKEDTAPPHSGKRAVAAAPAPATGKGSDKKAK